MKTFKFLAKALFFMVAVLTVGVLVSAVADHGTLFGLGSGVMAFGPLAMDRNYFHEIQATIGKGKASPSYLRIEQTLQNNKNRYSFDIKTTGNEIATERKLDRNDLFVVTHIGVFLTAQVSTSLGKEVLQTWPNTQVFVAASGFTPSDLEVIYNGFLEIKVGQKVNIPALSMQVFRQVPTSQQSSSIGNSEWDVEKMTYWPGTLIYLHGTQNIEVNIEFPALASAQIAAVASNTSNKLVFMPFGYLCKNSAKQL